MTVREATAEDASAIARVHVASWESTYRGIMSDELIDARTLEVRRSQWARGVEAEDRVTFVACDADGEMVGFSSALVLDAAVAGFDSYLQTLYLLPEAQGAGTGRALLRALVERFCEYGLRTMALRVVRLNSARSFYEKLGARLAPEGIANDDSEFDDVVYAFDDLEALRERLASPRNPRQ